MKIIIYILVLLFSLQSCGQIKYVDVLEKKQIERSGIISKNDTIKLTIKINNVSGNGPYFIAFDGLKKSFGFYKSNTVKVKSVDNTFKFKVYDLDGFQIQNNDIPLKEWVKVRAISNTTFKYRKINLGAYLYKNDDYQVSELILKDSNLVKGTKPFAIPKRPKNNFVTPQFFGYNPNDNKEFGKWKDASASLQKCFDSDYECRIAGGVYPIWEPIYLRKPKQILMTGRGFLPKYLRKNKYLTVIAPMTDRDAIVVQSEHAGIYNGLIYTGFAKNHSKAAIRFDLNYKMNYCELKDVTIQGSEDAVKIGFGTTAVLIDTDVTKDWGYLSFSNINVDITHVNKGIHVPNRRKGFNTWFNTVNFSGYMDGANNFIDVKWGSILAFDYLLQDRIISPNFNFKSVSINAEFSLVDVFLYDMGRSKDGFYGHKRSNYLDVGGFNTVFKNKSNIGFEPKLKHGLTNEQLKLNIK